MSNSDRFQNRHFDGAVFHDCSMARSRFEDIDLSEAVFADVNLSGVLLKNVNMTNVAIEDAKIDGLTILGCDVAELIRNHGGKAHSESTADIGRAAMAAEPQLFVSAIEASCQFYVDRLGFEVVFTSGEPPFYAQVARDGCRLNLRRATGAVFDASFRDREVDALAATLTLDDAGQLFAEFQKAGATFHQPLRTEPWGARTFIVRDPDGNLIAFAGRAR